MPSQATPAFLAHVAVNVRARRAAAGLSQRALAEASDVSLRMIGGIEAGSTSVSTATLDRIGMVLNATLAELVSDPAIPNSTLVDRVGWTSTRGGRGVLRWSLDARREVEAWEWRLAPGDRYDAGADPQGWHVMLFVLDGVLTLEIDGGRRRIERDAHLFDSTRAHAFLNLDDVPVRFFRCTSW